MADEMSDFFESPLRKLSPKDLAKTIAEGVSKICGRKVDCEVIKIMFDEKGNVEVGLNFSNNMDY